MEGIIVKPKKIPIRKCLGCQEMKPKKELMRIVKNKDNEISVDFIGKKPGRGAYVCSEGSCLEKAIKARRLEKVFESQIAPEVYETLSKTTIGYCNYCSNIFTCILP